jgi:hypothetical protein
LGVSGYRVVDQILGDYGFAQRPCVRADGAATDDDLQALLGKLRQQAEEAR